MDGIVGVDLPPAALAILKFRTRDKIYFQVFDQNGEHVAGDHILNEPPELIILDNPELVTIRRFNRELRLAEIKSRLTDRPGLTATVVVAQTTNTRSQLATEVLSTMAVPQLIVLIAGIFFVWSAIEAIIRPLTNLEMEIRSRRRNDLEPLSAQSAPSEVYPLVEAINNLFKRLKEDMQTQQRFIANAAHQLRTPLAGLKTYADVALEMDNLSEIKEVTKKISGGLDRAARMVNQLLTMARSDCQFGEAQEHSAVDLNEVASTVVSALALSADSKKIELALEQDNKPAIVLGDATMLEQMLQNLVDNAIIYTKAGGSVEVKVARRGAEIELSVSDSGIGIAAHDKEKIFERFYRSEGSPGTGSGLGLAIVKEVARSHNAGLAVESPASQTVKDEESPGTTFKVTFSAAG